MLSNKFGFFKHWTKELATTNEISRALCSYLDDIGRKHA